MKFDWGALAEEAVTGIWEGTDKVFLTRRLESFLSDNGHSLASGEVLDNFEKFRRLVIIKLAKRIDKCSYRGEKPRYRFSTVNDDVLIPLIGKSEDELRKQIKGTIEELGWRDFERFSAYLLHVTGVDNAKLFRGTKEEGIDIYGILNLDKLMNRTMWLGAQVRVLGQAKISKIVDEKVRLFNNDLSSFRQKEGRAWEQAPDWFRHSKSPIIGFMMSVKGFNGGAIRWGKRNGILLKDATQMIEAMMNIGNIPGLTAGSTTFSRRAFVESLRAASAS